MKWKTRRTDESSGAKGSSAALVVAFAASAKRNLRSDRIVLLKEEKIGRIKVLQCSRVRRDCLLTFTHQGHLLADFLTAAPLTWFCLSNKQSMLPPNLHQRPRGFALVRTAN